MVNVLSAIRQKEWEPWARFHLSPASSKVIIGGDEPGVDEVSGASL